MIAGYKVHVIDKNTNRLIAKPIMGGVPSIGEELRLAGERYYEVVHVVWILDEPECPYQRVNIGVTTANEPT